MEALELWGGLECTVNRTGNDYFDQLRSSGHDDRSSDLELFAAVGIKAIRYPVLWERVAPDRDAEPDWGWCDDRLNRLRELGIKPIAGLVHHGSGPSYTNLLDPSFATGLARYAGEVAQRYPWIEDWTPVNEPLTTARFSALYGHWYPHLRDESSFWLALLNQVDATRLAMRAVRRINAAARLIQTDDLGRTYATLRLAEQAAFDNLRRWAGWDLLFGMVTRHHPLWDRLDRVGLGDRLRRIADDPCPPDVVGVNHYLTSDRFLDHRLQRYPTRVRGGNGATSYADVEAIRILDPPPAGLTGALREAWQRYSVPLALTEVHNGCTREEQLRWAAEAWDASVALRADGVPVRAVTAWSLLGSQGWNTLLTSPGSYEPGVFDVSSGKPRATALANLWRGLPSGAARHPVSDEPGWWHRPDRLIYAPLLRPAGTGQKPNMDGMPLLIVAGTTGRLCRAFAEACAARGIRHVLCGRETVDLERPAGMADALDGIQPWAVVNAADWAGIEEAESGESTCQRMNAAGPVALAEACAARDIAYLGFSSALVFDGRSSRPYVESDEPAPLGAYGRSKAAMEAGCAAGNRALVVRTGPLFSADDPTSFAMTVLNALAGGGSFVAAGDHVVTPTFVPTLVDAALDLLIDGAAGIWHLSGGETISWAAFAMRVAEAGGYAASQVVPVTGSSLGWQALRPLNAGLSTERGSTISTLQADIERFAADHRHRFARARAA